MSLMSNRPSIMYYTIQIRGCTLGLFPSAFTDEVYITTQEATVSLRTVVELRRPEMYTSYMPLGF